jgi:hypothetical protein
VDKRVNIVQFAQSQWIFRYQSRWKNVKIQTVSYETDLITRELAPHTSYKRGNQAAGLVRTRISSCPHLPRGFWVPDQKDIFSYNWIAEQQYPVLPVKAPTVQIKNPRRE